MRQNWEIVDDPEGAELIRTPSYQIAQARELGYFAGDCDDAATLAAGLLLALDWPGVFVALRLSMEVDFSHVWTRAPLLMPEFSDGGPQYWDIDPIVPDDIPRPLIGEELIVSF